jgi:phosphoenolpyruvate synthase/pyruvate phosphate dikinase
LRRRLARVPLPQDVKQAIADAIASLKLDGAARFAVRSSSTLEELPQAAFAGQHDTFLNVQGVNDVSAKVRDCFVSLWGDRAVLYRHHQGYRQQHARMAVVVQQQVSCDRAGVGFSVDPVTGDLRRMVVDANYGLGESVVAGECEVDHLLLDKATLEVVPQSVGHKDRMIVPAAEGTEERSVDAELARAPCLNERQVVAVGRLVARVEAHYGWPQDIEWGLMDGRLFLFQSRAVTTLQPRFTRDESAERFPNAMTPLSWDFLGAVFRESMAYSLQLMGLPPLKEDWFTLIDHYVYGNQNAVELLASYRPMRARTLEELVAEFPDFDIQRYRQPVYTAKLSFDKARRSAPKWSLDEQTSVNENATTGQVLRGLPGSPGTASGRCFLVRGPEDFGQFPAGSILVARTTNPAWTPLFYSASGLITESGGPLSHGAVTAREMRLPAVMSVRGVMTRLKNEDSVTVDGNRGTVTCDG